MNSGIETRRRRTLDLLDETRRETRSALSALDPERVVHTDQRAWRVRDVIGHLGVWNAEAARSLSAYAAGSAYYCIPSESGYYDYNGPAADERRAWPLQQVWAEYEQSHDQLRLMVETMSVEKWDGELLFPWRARGTVEDLIGIMMRHERVDHCDLIRKATSARGGVGCREATGISGIHQDNGGIHRARGTRP